MLYRGSCHCAAVQFEVTADPVEMTTCDCSLCAKRNALMIRVPESALRITLGEEMLATYQWNMRRAKHHFCKRCGIYTFHRKRIDPSNFGINIFCLESFDRSKIPIRATEGKSMSLAGDAES